MDFDIDTTNFTKYTIGKQSKITHWSPFVNFDSYGNLKASDKLPYPTGDPLVEFGTKGDLPKIDISDLVKED